MQCAAERKYCAGVLGQLRGRAAAQLRGNIDLKHCMKRSIQQLKLQLTEVD